MISLFFGLPGSGKSTIICWRIVNHLMQIDRGKSPYDHIYTNCDISFAHPALTICDYATMRDYDLGDRSLLMIDEAQMDMSSRAYKSFGKQDLRLFSQHRRYGYSIELYTQRWDGLDIAVRCLTTRVFYVKKSLIRCFSHVYPVKYGIDIPRAKDKDSAHYGEITQAYTRWGFIDRLFHPRVFRPVVYGLYDSFVRPPCPPLSPTS